MKKSIIFLVSMIFVVITVFDGLFMASADEQESQVTVTLFKDRSTDSPLLEEQKQIGNENQAETNKSQKELPKTNDEDNILYLIIGLVFLVIIIVRILYNKKNGEQYNEKI